MSLYSANPASRRLAMLIDGDNAQAKLLDKMLEEASKHGTVTIRRIYGDWTDSGMSQWRDAANKYAFQTQHQLSYTKGKNATDTFLIIDAMDILHSGYVDGFCIVSSDSDFTGLAKRIRESGMFVMGMGRAVTPESFRKACEVFTHVELLTDPQQVAIGLQGKPSAPDAAGRAHAESDSVSESPLPDWKDMAYKAMPAQAGRQDNPFQLPDWKDMVYRAIEATAQEEWARLSDVGNSIVKDDSSFDVRSYGSKTLLSLVKTAPDKFEVREEPQEGHTPVHYVRIVRE